MILRYFIAEGEKAEQVKLEIHAGMYSSAERRKALVEKYGAIGTWDTDELFGRKSTVGLLFPYIDNQRPTPIKGLRFKSKPESCEGKKYWIATPSRGPAARSLKHQLALSSPFNYSRHALDAYGLWREVRSGCSLVWSTAGIYADTLVFKVPFAGDGDADLAECAEAIPPDLREIKPWEFQKLIDESH